MSILYKLEKKFGHLAIPNLTYYLILGQVLAFMLITMYPEYAGIFELQGNRVLAGEWWRLITYLFKPLSTHFIFAVFVLYIYYLYGTSLEKTWGSFRYLTYLLISYIGTIIISFVFPYEYLANGYMYSSLFLAYAYLFPDFKILLFFILPVKIKWLALLVWAGIGVSVIFGSIVTKILAIVSILNFLVFFGDELIALGKRRFGKLSRDTGRSVVGQKAYHICAVCGTNEVENPDMEIRYCNKCVPSRCYCGEHIDTHEHRTSQAKRTPLNA